MWSNLHHGFESHLLRFFSITRSIASGKIEELIIFTYSMTDNFKVTQTQHGYKNKSFHTGKLEIEKTQFNYIYDCGLSKTEFLKYYKKNPNPIDILFISHFHKDHINDVLDLVDLEIFKDTVVVLPYKSDRDKLLFGAIGNINNDSPDTNINRYLKFLSRPYTIWIKSDDYESQYSPVRHLDSSFRVNLANYQHTDIDLKHDEINSKFIKLFTLKFGAKGLNWILLTYSAHTEKLNKIWDTILTNTNDQELQQLSEQYTLNGDLPSARALIQKLIKCIKNIKVSKIDGDNSFANLISLSLYSGPMTKYDELHNLGFQSGHEYLTNFLCTYPSWCNLYNFWSDNVGWLHTGDSNLKDENLYKRFTSFYENIFNKVGVFTLPHHGSKNSINEKIIKNYNWNFVITEHSSAKIDKQLDEMIKNKTHNLYYVTKNKSLELETISNNLNFIGKICER